MKKYDIFLGLLLVAVLLNTGFTIYTLNSVRKLEDRDALLKEAQVLSDKGPLVQQSAGSECSSVQDEICPKWCAAGADYDCCVAKGEGWEWVEGRGCYVDPLLVKGIHPDPVQMRILNRRVEWEDKSISYNLEKVYLTPDIADLGKLRFSEVLKDKSFLVAEVHIRNRSTRFGKRVIPIDDYFRLRKAGKNSTPLPGTPVILSSQEDGVIYVIFPVEKEGKEFALLVGILSKPRILEMNFSSESVDTIKGVFLKEKGFFSEYNFE